MLPANIGLRPFSRHGALSGRKRALNLGGSPSAWAMHRNGGNSEARRLLLFVIIAPASLTSWRMWSETPWPGPRITNDPDWPKGTYSFSPDAFAIAYPNSHSGAAPTCQVGVFLLVKRSLRSVVRPALGVLHERIRCPGMLVACISSIGERRRLGRGFIDKHSPDCIGACQIVKPGLAPCGASVCFGSRCYVY